MGLSFTITAGPRQRSHSRVRFPRNSCPYFIVSDSRLSQPGGPGTRIYIPQEQGGPVIPPGTWFPFRRLLPHAGLRWRYSTLPPHGINSHLNSCSAYIISTRTNRKQHLHSWSPTVALLGICCLAMGTCLLSRCLETGLAHPPISRSLRNNGTTRYNMKPINVVGEMQSLCILKLCSIHSRHFALKEYRVSFYQTWSSRGTAVDSYSAGIWFKSLPGDRNILIKCFRGFSQSLQENAGKIHISIRPQTLSSKSFIIHQPSYLQTLCSLYDESVGKQPISILSFGAYEFRILETRNLFHPTSETEYVSSSSYCLLGYDDM
jgi:hypothetical protein